MALFQGFIQPIMLITKGMDALLNTTKEPLYKESKACTIYIAFCSLVVDVKGSIRLV